jgi:hypothetical protein
MGVDINGHLFTGKQPLREYSTILDQPSRTVPAGPPAPAGHRNNMVHIYDSLGIYLTEHHQTKLIESINVYFDVTESPFPMRCCFTGFAAIEHNKILPSMAAADLNVQYFTNSLPGEYQKDLANCWVNVKTARRRDSRGRRRRSRYVVGIAFCPHQREANNEFGPE